MKENDSDARCAMVHRTAAEGGRSSQRKANKQKRKRMSIRGIERATGIHRITIMNLGVRVGYTCAKIQNEKLRGLKCKHIKFDEIWGASSRQWCWSE